MSPDAPQGETLKGHADPLNLDGEGLAGIVRRAVAQATSKKHAPDIIADALSRGEGDVIPTAAGPLTAFVLGPLYDAAMHAAGVDKAERIILILKPVLVKRSELELGSLPPESQRRKTVLIVDKDIVVRAQLLSILTGAGYEAISAPDGNVALAMSVRCRPDLVISELNMGSVRGSQLSTLLRVAFNDDAPPIIILTDDMSWSDPASGIRVLSKPIDRVTVLGTVLPLIGEATRTSQAG